MIECIRGLCNVLAGLGIVFFAIVAGYLALMRDPAMLLPLAICGGMAGVGFTGLSYLGWREDQV